MRIDAILVGKLLIVGGGETELTSPSADEGDGIVATERPWIEDTAGKGGRLADRRLVVGKETL